jgi:hypothetical protein
MLNLILNIVLMFLKKNIKQIEIINKHENNFLTKFEPQTITIALFIFCIDIIKTYYNKYQGEEINKESKKVYLFYFYFFLCSI